MVAVLALMPAFLGGAGWDIGTKSSFALSASSRFTSQPANKPSIPSRGTHHRSAAQAAELSASVGSVRTENAEASLAGLTARGPGSIRSLRRHQRQQRGPTIAKQPSLLAQGDNLAERPPGSEGVTEFVMGRAEGSVRIQNSVWQRASPSGSLAVKLAA